MSETKEDLEQSVSRQQRIVRAAGAGAMSVLRSSREGDEQRRQYGIESQELQRLGDQ